MTQELRQKMEAIINRNPQADDREIVFQLKQLLYEGELQNFSYKEAKSMAQLVADNLSQLHEGEAQSTVVKTGFDDFDAPFGGFRLGEFIVVGGRPAMGKTQFLVNLSLHISATFPVLFIAFDMSEPVLASRFMASASGIPAGDILQHKISPQQKARLAGVGNLFEKRRLFLSDGCHPSIAAIRAYCQKQIQENGIQVIVVDYLQLITSYHHKKFREQEVSHISRELKNMAKEYNVCVIVSSQLNRSVEMRGGNRRPMLSDLRESGAIEQDADKVIFIHRPEAYGILEDGEGNSLIDVVEVIVAKNRIGCLGGFMLMKDSNFTSFRSVNTEFTFSMDRLHELEEDLPL